MRDRLPIVEHYQLIEPAVDSGLFNREIPVGIGHGHPVTGDRIRYRG